MARKRCTTPDGAETSLRLALAQHYDITQPSTDLLKAAADAARRTTRRACSIRRAGTI